MENKVLVVIDMQNDFLDGALANEEGCKIIDKIAERIEKAKSEGAAVFFTRDTHSENYMDTQEGHMLPVPHCLRDTEGWQITEKLGKYAENDFVVDKPAFGSLKLPELIKEKAGEPSEIELCGVCTDICVISNAMILKAAFPETPVVVDSGLCAGVTPESHKTALDAMRGCQVIVK